MYLYPKWLRIWHVVNAILFLILIVTGVSMQYTDKENTLLSWLVLPERLNGIILQQSSLHSIISFCNGKRLYRKWQDITELEKENFMKNLMTQLKYYSGGMFKGEKHPFPVTEERKFNPLQKFTYVLAMYLAFTFTYHFRYWTCSFRK